MVKPNYKDCKCLIPKPTKEIIEEITDEYGQLHEKDCDLNNEYGSFDGCDCAMKSLVEEVSKIISSQKEEFKRVVEGMNKKEKITKDDGSANHCAEERINGRTNILKAIEEL